MNTKYNCDICGYQFSSKGNQQSVHAGRKLSSYAAPLPQRLHYCIIAYSARETDGPRVYSDAAEIQHRLQFYCQFTATLLFDPYTFQSSQLQPDDPRSSPGREVSPPPAGTELFRTCLANRNLCAKMLSGALREDCGGGRDWAAQRLGGGPEGRGGGLHQAGTQAHHGGSSAVSFIDSRVAQ